MAMSTGAKIGVGCAVVFFVGVIGVAIAVFGAAWWARGKVKEATAGLEQAAGKEKEVAALKARADRNTFTPPADRSISEDRLLKFLAVRKAVFGLVEQNKTQFEAMSKKNPEGMEALKAIGTVAALVNEARLVQAQALVDQGMSSDEYRYYVAQVYTTLWAAEISKATGAKNFSEAAGAVMNAAAEQAEKAAKEAEQNGQSPAIVEELRENARKAREQANASVAEAEKVDVPPANIELFKKHEEEIKKYALTGLEWLGL